MLKFQLNIISYITQRFILQFKNIIFLINQNYNDRVVGVQKFCAEAR